jgi:hypothetical protein
MVSRPPSVVPVSNVSMTESWQTYPIAWLPWTEIATDAPPPLTLPA